MCLPATSGLVEGAETYVLCALQKQLAIDVADPKQEAQAAPKWQVWKRFRKQPPTVEVAPEPRVSPSAQTISCAACAHALSPVPTSVQQSNCQPGSWEV